MRFIDESIISGKGIQMIDYCGKNWKVWIDERYLPKAVEPSIAAFIVEESTGNCEYYITVDLDRNWERAILLNINFALAGMYAEYLLDETSNCRQ